MMDKQMQEAADIQTKLSEAENTVKELGPKRNSLIVKLSKKHTKASIARALGLTPQRIIQVIKKESARTA